MPVRLRSVWHDETPYRTTWNRYVANEVIEQHVDGERREQLSLASFTVRLVVSTMHSLGHDEVEAIVGELCKHIYPIVHVRDDMNLSAAFDESLREGSNHLGILGDDSTNIQSDSKNTLARHRYFASTRSAK